MIATLAWLLLQTPVQAPEESRPWRGVEFTLGAFLAEIDSEIALGSDSGLGATLDVEDLLDLDDSVLTLRLGVSVALGARHRLHLDIFDMSRRASTDLGRDIDFGGTVYPRGTHVESVMGLQLYNLTYGFSMLQDDRIDVAVTFGFHGLRTAIRLEADDLEFDESERFFIPIPLPGLRADFALTRALWLRQRLELMWFRIGNYEGLLTDASIGLEYALFNNVGFGVAYNALRFSLDMKEDELPLVKFVGQVDFDFTGVLLYVSVFF